jgi:hypothetical protein
MSMIKPIAPLADRAHYQPCEYTSVAEDGWTEDDDASRQQRQVFVPVAYASATGFVVMTIA